MIGYIVDHVVSWFQKRCKHIQARADLLEGDSKTHSVSWCPNCGAVKINNRPWRIPDARVVFVRI